MQKNCLLSNHDAASEGVGPARQDKLAKAKKVTMLPTVLYDEACFLCRNLAELMASRSEGRLLFTSWQAYWAPKIGELSRVEGEISGVPAPDRLHVVVEGTMFGGVIAWEYLLNAHPDLASFSWLAGRLGLSQEVAKAFQGTASLLKKVCPRCRRKF